MQLLDTQPDEALDVVTRLAAQVLGVPVALVSLVDDERQFFKSQVGLPQPWSDQRQTPLTHSFCQWVVSSQDELAVADARTHPVLRRNRAIADLGVIAYAGVPLSAISGRPIGSFCAIDGKPRDWDDDDLATLRDLAQLVNAHTAVSVPPSSDPRPSARHDQLLAITRAAGRGFVGAARLLRRGHPALTAEQRHAVAGVVERLSQQLLEVADDTAEPHEEQGVGVVDLIGSNS
jgi:hypothetical protein